MLDLITWRRLAETAHQELVRLAGEVAPGDVAGVERLRRVCSDVEVVRAALMLAEARRKAVGKFGAERAATLWADPEGVEMATSALVGAYKWREVMVFWPGCEALDACCGIGGDSMAIAAQGAGAVGVRAVDHDPVRVWMAERNSGCRGVCADIADAPLTDGPFHIDPARRDGGGRRAWALEDLAPPPETWRRIIDHRSDQDWGGMIKLGPGLDLERAHELFPEAAIEIVSENGVLVQALLRFGVFNWGWGPRMATMLVGRSGYGRACEFTLAGAADGATVPAADGSRPGRYVYEPDDSVERSGLLGVLCEKLGAAMLDVRVGLLTSDARIESPWVTGFEVLEVMGWNEKRVKAALEARGAGIVEVKTRGRVVDPDVVQRALRGRGDEPFTVFVLRFGREVRAIVARRV